MYPLETKLKNDQSGCIKGRNIADNIRLMILIRRGNLRLSMLCNITPPV